MTYCLWDTTTQGGISEHDERKPTWKGFHSGKIIMYPTDGKKNNFESLHLSDVYNHINSGGSVIYYNVLPRLLTFGLMNLPQSENINVGPEKFQDSYVRSGAAFFLSDKTNALLNIKDDALVLGSGVFSELKIYDIANSLLREVRKENSNNRVIIDSINLGIICKCIYLIYYFN